MKRPQRNFSVEYKSGRRKAGIKSSSIWGDIDLKSVAQDVQEKGAARSLNDIKDDKAGSETSLSLRPSDEQLLTQSLKQSKEVLPSEEIVMAVESDNVADAPVSVVTDEAVAPPPVRKRRGRKPKSAEEKDEVTKRPLKRGPRKKELTPAVAIDEIADLLQLEQENQRLRRLLAEKLRAENADLRKRLNLD